MARPRPDILERNANRGARLSSPILILVIITCAFDKKIPPFPPKIPLDNKSVLDFRASILRTTFVRGTLMEYLSKWNLTLKGKYV